MKYIKHIAGVLKDSVQRCIICGDVITDYRNTMVCQNPDGTVPALNGFPEGDVYLSIQKSPQISTTMLSNEDEFVICK